jgi:hypothetical protein
MFFGSIIILYYYGACSKQGREREREKMHTKFWSETLRRRDHSEVLGVDGRKILE